MKPSALLCSALVLIPVLAAQPAAPHGSIVSLEDGFQNPPGSARPSAYYLLLNGYFNADYADRELEQLAAKGVGGLCIFDMGGRGPKEFLPPPGPPFLSDAWLDQLARLLTRAKALGLSAQLAVSSSWDMGASWVQAKDSSMALYHTELEVDGAQHLKFPLPELPDKVPRNDQGQPLFLHEVAVLAFPKPSPAAPQTIARRESIRDLTAQLGPDGRLDWEAPPGRWVILRFVCANTGERLKVPSPASDGLATDHLNADVTRAYLRHLTDRLQARLGDLSQTALKQLYLPSYEVVGRLWTPDLPEQFKNYRQYNLVPYLPVLAGYLIEDRETTEAFRYDFNKTMGDLLVDAYYRTASATAREVELGIEAEAGGPGPPVHQVPVDALKALGAIDELRGEFWPWRLTNDPLWVVKETASAAHVYGRSVVHMEAFTGFHHWTAGPYDLKFSADRAFAEGMNHVVWHTSSHQPPEAGQPGWVYGAGTHLTPNLVWWSQAKPFLDYLARSSYLLQQGRFVADVCYYYGDQGFNFVPPKHVDPALGPGYDYDVVNPEVILTRMRVDQGRITLPDGMHYELLALPEREDIDLEVLLKLAELVKAGATLVGPKPVRAHGLTQRSQRDAQVRQTADELWGPCDGRSVFEHRYGQGTIVWGHSLRRVLQDRKQGPDFTFSQADADLDYIHRRTAEADIYFVRNKLQRWEQVDVEFRVQNKTPEIWRADTGERQPLPVFQRTATGIKVPLKLAPWDAFFVVFRDTARGVHLTAADPALTVQRSATDSIEVTAEQNGSYRVSSATGDSMDLTFANIPPPYSIAGPWQVHFAPGWDVPPVLTFDELKSWTDHSLDAVRFFSGVARYETTFEVSPEWQAHADRITLDLGELWAVGTVHLNGRLLGTLWKPPFRIEIRLGPGTNRLAIEVANTWANRLIGDAPLPAHERRTRTNITRSGGKLWKDVPLHPSGLFGPVRLIPSKTKRLDLAGTR